MVEDPRREPEVSGPEQVPDGNRVEIARRKVSLQTAAALVRRGLELALRRESPADVALRPEAAWAALAAGWWHSLALKRDGTLWAWGWDPWGQLGLGDGVDRDRPTQVGADADWATLAGGDHHSLALKRDGTLWAWGVYDSRWFSLTGRYAESHTPTRVGDDADWATLAAGAEHSLALKRDGTLWAWGYNDSGRLGLGDNDDRGTPTQVGAE